MNQKMVEVFTEVKRVLKKEGTLWLNLGDSYARNPQTESDPVKNSGFHTKNGTALTASAARNQRPIPVGLKAKDLIGIPWMVAFALRSSGWYLRQDIIWHKPNPMPESVTDRCTKSHEYIFLLSKSQKYYYDHEAIKVDGLNPADDIRRKEKQRECNKSNPTAIKNGIRRKPTAEQESAFMGNVPTNLYRCGDSEDGKANKRSVWTVTTKPFSDAHFATFPEDLIVDCIKAGCPENGLVLDPFMGAGTTALVASKLNRNFIGFELNADYIEIAKKRLQNELGMFNKLTA
jgi:DNA modification methylase